MFISGDTSDFVMNDLLTSKGTHDSFKSEIVILCILICFRIRR